MSLRPLYKKCPVCKMVYSWNPDVGQMFCPYCTGKKAMPKGLKKIIVKYLNWKKSHEDIII